MEHTIGANGISGYTAHFSQLIADDASEQKRSGNGKIDLFGKSNDKTYPFVQ
jgi:hypothetical protein